MATKEVKVMDDVDIVSFEPETASRKEWERFHRFRRLRHQERDPEDPMLDDQTIERMMKRPDPSLGDPSLRRNRLGRPGGPDRHAVLRGS